MFWRPLGCASSGIRLNVIRRRFGCIAIFEELAEQRFRQFAADKDDRAFALLIFFPFTREIKARHHVHALENDATWFALDVQNALVAKHLFAVQIDERADVAIHFAHVERAFAFDVEAMNFVVVLVIVVSEKNPAGFRR
jgi:hypothetical protein